MGKEGVRLGELSVASGAQRAWVLPQLRANSSCVDVSLGLDAKHSARDKHLVLHITAEIDDRLSLRHEEGRSPKDFARADAVGRESATRWSSPRRSQFEPGALTRPRTGS